MKSIFAIFIVLTGVTITSNAQTNTDQESSIPVWTEEDRKYLLDNLVKSKEELIQETKNLTEKQWNFKESPDRWNINQIVEHLAIWELIVMNEISVALQIGEFPQIKKYPPDSLFLGLDPEKNETTNFTKPFSYSVPLGNNTGRNNLIWLISMRDESIEFVKEETRNLRVYYINFGPNIHHKCMQIFAHTYRHLRQIEKIKADPNYPK
ncbi:MAG: DinB family protein [Cyclobacteriaceae bacterium]